MKTTMIEQGRPHRVRVSQCGPAKIFWQAMLIDSLFGKPHYTDDPENFVELRYGVMRIFGNPPAEVIREALFQSGEGRLEIVREPAEKITGRLVDVKA